MFNAAFGKNPARFTRSYISKIAGQVAWARHVILGNNFRFTCCDWKEAVSHARRGDFVYIDPPYLGRTTTYYEGWNEDDAAGLLEWSRTAECAFAISSWSKNAYRENPELKKYVDHCTIALASHFYFIGSTEENRHEMQEALILKKKVEKT
jgi:DNA adenine methylase